MSSRSAEHHSAVTRRILPWTLAVSLLVHGAAYAGLEPAPRSWTPARVKTQLRFDVVEKARVAPPEPAPAVAPPQPAKTAPRLAARPAVEPPTPTPTPPAATDAAPLPAAGVTLAGEGSGSSFAMPLGDGGALDPTRVGSPAVVRAPSPAAVLAPPVNHEPALVAMSDLSARPTPPALGPALERNYPPDARRRGLSGQAKVRARIDPDGVVRRVSLLEESAPGFGSACSRSLSGSRWAAPKDKAGRAVATEIRYTCRFVVE